MNSGIRLDHPSGVSTLTSAEFQPVPPVSPPELLVDHGGDPRSRREIFRAELQPYVRRRFDGWSQPFDRRAVRHAPDRRMVDRLRVSAASGYKTPGHHRPLRDGIHLTLTPAMTSSAAGRPADCSHRRSPPPLHRSSFPVERMEAALPSP